MCRKTGVSGNSLYVLAVFVILFSMFIINAHGKDKGVVTSIRDGRLERFSNNNWGLVSVGQEIPEGDRLRTDKTAVAIIEFPEIGRFVIGPSSEVEMGKDPKNFQSKIDRGAMWLKSALPQGNRAAITTSLATAGIRGTAFSAVYGEGEKAVCICTCTGEVEVTLKDGQTIKVPKGEYLAVESGTPAPEKAKTSVPVLEKTGTVFDFCFNCHVVGGKGNLKRDEK